MPLRRLEWEVVSMGGLEVRTDVVGRVGGWRSVDEKDGRGKGRWKRHGLDGG